MSSDPAASQLCPPTHTHTHSAKVELGGLGCRIRISTRKGGVRSGTAQAATLGLGHGVRVPLPILPRPHPKSQHPGITHHAGRPAPGGSPPYPAPPHPHSRETRKPGVEQKQSLRRKADKRNPSPPSLSAPLKWMMILFFLFSQSLPSKSLYCSPKTDQKS